MFTWHRGDFRAGASSLRFPPMALYLFLYSNFLNSRNHKLIQRTSLKRQRTSNSRRKPSTYKPKIYTKKFKIIYTDFKKWAKTWFHHKCYTGASHPSFCIGARIILRYEISQRCHVNAKRPPVSMLNRSAGVNCRWARTGSVCVMFAILNRTCILSRWTVRSNNRDIK